MEKFRFVVIIVGLLGVVWAGNFYYKNFRGAVPAFKPAPAVNTTKLPLSLPEEFTISIFAHNIPNARVLVWDPMGNLLVSSPAKGKVFKVAQDGTVTDVISDLNKPHGLAFLGNKLYIAETDAVAVYDYDGKATNRKKIIDLPGGGNHFSRTIGFGPDGKLYISVGSSCNVCVEKDWRRASILVANPDGTELKTYASGLRNSVFFIWRGQQMWATDMGRDMLGDNTPPEEVNIVIEGGNYGWPYCYSKQVPDKTFKGTQEYCNKTISPVIEYQAHAAPLGLAFDPNGDLLVAFHGSWNRTEPTGYKVVRFDLDDNGNVLDAEDFITEWLAQDGALGRPVDLMFDKQGALYISDDKAGVVYKVVK